MSLTRRSFIAGVTALASTAALPLKALAEMMPVSARRPNIILFIADDMRYDAAGFAGNRIIKTPFLDALAKDSVVFDYAFVTTSICPTSRASIYSGDYALKHTVRDFRNGMRRRSAAKVFFGHLRKAGYYTGFIGKWGIGGPLPKRIFNVWHGFTGQGSYISKAGKAHLTDRQTTQAVEFIQRCPKDKPFLLIVCYKAPHQPYVPQKQFSDMYADLQVSPNSTTRAQSEHVPPLLQPHMNALANTPQDMQRQADDVRKYYQLVSGIDDSVGQIMKCLSDQNIMDDTSLIFTSDNGMMLGDHGMWGKWYMYEESIRVPLLIKPAKNIQPDVIPGRVNALALNVDISPTILAMANAAPQHTDGANLLSLMKNHNMPWRKGFFYEFSGFLNMPECMGYRTHEWKYVYYFTMNRDNPQSNECLYHLNKDPNETQNLAFVKGYDAVRESLKTLMLAERDRLVLS